MEGLYSEDRKQTDHKRQRARLAFHKSRVHGLSQEIIQKRVGCILSGRNRVRLQGVPSPTWGTRRGGPTRHS